MGRPAFRSMSHLQSCCSWKICSDWFEDKGGGFASATSASSVHVRMGAQPQGSTLGPAARPARRAALAAHPERCSSLPARSLHSGG